MTDTAKEETRSKRERKPPVARAPHIKAQAAAIRILEPLSEADRRKVIRSIAALFDADAYFNVRSAVMAD